MMEGILIWILLINFFSSLLQNLVAVLASVVHLKDIIEARDNRISTENNKDRKGDYILI